MELNRNRFVKGSVIKILSSGVGHFIDNVNRKRGLLQDFKPNFISDYDYQTSMTDVELVYMIYLK